MVSKNTGGRPKNEKITIERARFDYFEHIISLIKSVVPEMALEEIRYQNGKCIKDKLGKQKSFIELGLDKKTFEKIKLDQPFIEKNIKKLEARFKGICNLFNVKFIGFYEYIGHARAKVKFDSLIQNDIKKVTILLGFLYLLGEEHNSFGDLLIEKDKEFLSWAMASRGEAHYPFLMKFENDKINYISIHDDMFMTMNSKMSIEDLIQNMNNKLFFNE